MTRGLDLAPILAVTRDAVRAAGALVLEGFRRNPVIEHKGAVDLVTVFDRDSEALLRERLSALPYAIVGEETGGDAAEIAFYVDPIDGTTNFVHGHPFWCVSVGLVVSGEPVLGVVLAPALGVEWYGALGDDAQTFRRSATNGIVATSQAEPLTERARVSGVARFEDSLLATGFPYDRRTSPDNNFNAFVAIKRRCQAVRRCGSAAIDLCLVADGTYDGYWERKLKPWDIAGGIAIVKGAGGRVTEIGGGSSYIRTGTVVATNGAIHDALLHELSLVP